MGFGEWLWSAHNVPFLVAIGFALVMATIEMITGGLSDLVSLDLDADADLDTAPIGLAWLGIGKAPLSVLVMTLLASAGLLGLLVHGLAWDLFAVTTPALVASVPVAVLGSVTVTRLVGETFHRLLPATEGIVKPAGSHVGAHGRVTVALSPRSGEVCVETRPVPSYLQTRATEDIPRGAQVLLASYDTSVGAYVAEPIPALEERPREGTACSTPPS